MLVQKYSTHKFCSFEYNQKKSVLEELIASEDNMAWNDNCKKMRLCE